MHIHVSRMRAAALGGSIQIAATFQGVVRVQLDDDGDALREELLAQYPEASFKRPSAVMPSA